MAYSVISFEFGTPTYDQALKLRTEILRKPLGFDFEVDFLAAEYDVHHFGVINDMEELVACLIMEPKDETTIKMRQVAVDQNLQGKGLGRQLVAFVEAWSKLKGYKTITLNARETAIPFYEKLDYTTTSDYFTEVTIPHKSMMKEL